MSEQTTEEQSVAPQNGGQSGKPKGGFWGKVDSYFGITKSGSNYKTEIIAGLTTFMAMAYILLVNPGIFTATYDVDGVTYSFIPNVSFGGMYIATALGAIVGTLLMAFLAKMPLAQASGLGVNAFVVYTLVGSYGLTFANAMVFTLLDGVIFILLTVTGLRKYIFEAIPDEVRKAINVGIGLFIAFIGFQNAGVIVDDSATLVGFVSFNVLSSSASFGAMLPAIVAILGVIAIAIMSHYNIKGAILWGVIGSGVLYYILAGIGYGAGDATCKAIFTAVASSWESPFAAFKDWGNENVAQVFINGFDFSAYLDAHSVGALIVLVLTSALSLCMVDMFDTLGTLYGACAKGDLLDEKGNPLNMNRCMLADAIATTAGAFFGTSTVTTFVESSSGVSVGGKTGFTALVTALCFIVAMFISPIAQLIPYAATSAALIWVGILMMGSVTKIEWTKPSVALPAFLTIAVMAFGYSISFGIGIGIISSVIVRICTGKVKSISIITWVIAVLFVLMFLFTN
jgi:AGZA family xanthine/uracil permease-like MFS transporter